MTTATKLTSHLILEQLLLEGASAVFHGPRCNPSPLVQLLNTSQVLKCARALSERAASFMAIGHSQSTARPPVLVLSPGQGALNALPAIYTAKQIQVPLIVLCEQQSTQIMNDDPVLALDNLALVSKLTKWSAEARSPVEVTRLIRRAFTEALAPPKGPVMLSLPLDILYQYAQGEVINPPHVSPLGAAADNFLKKTAKSLVTAKNPCIIAGNEVNQFRARKEVVVLAEVLGCPVYTEPMPTGVNFPNRHPQFGGVLHFGLSTIKEKLKEHDLVLALGMQTRLSAEADKMSLFNPRAAIIQVNVEPTLAGKSLPCIAAATADIAETMTRLRAEIQLVADARCLSVAKIRAQETIKQITEERMKLEEELVYPSHNDPISLFWLLRTLDGVRPTGSIIVNDILSIHADPCSVMSLETSSSYVSSNACIDGYGLPAGLGVQLSLTAQELPVIVLTSDESIMQCSEALWSVAHYQLPIKIVIVSAGGAALLIQPQTPAQIGFPFNSPTIDFQKMGEAMGLKVFTATIMEEMEEAITRLFEEEGPCVLNVKVSG